MPTINPSIVPTIAPGRLFSRFTTDDTLNIRWLTAKDPAFYEVLNRPIVDSALRSLILAKAVDTLYSSLGHAALYPFLVQPRVGHGTNVVDVPLNWIWSLNIAIPKKWRQVRLAKIKRMSGANEQTGGYSGILRLLFSAVQVGQPTESYLFYVDYQIDSVLSYQLAKLNVVTTQEESNAINHDEIETIAGSITFRTMDTTELLNSQFLNLLEPPQSPIDLNGDGLYDNPTIYEVVDTLGGGSTTANDFSTLAISHGTGMLTEAAWTGLPQLDSDAQSWVNAMNYPFDLNANRTSVTGIRIPLGMFREFVLTVPAGDEPSGTSNQTYFPVWLSKARLVNINQVRLYFSTYNTTEAETGGAPSLQPIEFAYLDIFRNGQPGDRLPILPNDNLKLVVGDEAALWTQHFGRGHVVLSNIWSSSSADVDGFFADMSAILESPQITEFSKSSTRISSYGTHQVPRYAPTAGQSRALMGTTSKRIVPISPSQDNMYVTEQDQGQGNTVDLEAQPGITPNSAIERYGYSGSLCHRVVKLIIYSDEIPSGDPNFYDTNILPRLRILLGRDPQFGDFWYNGTRLVFFNGDSWQD